MFLNGFILTNYKFDLKSSEQDENELDDLPREKNHNSKRFNQIENINILKEDFNILGNL